MSAIAERLYQLLPAFYRANDLAQGEPLRALLGVLETELQAVRDDVDGLYDNWFIETCDRWVVAYLGDLVGADTPPSPLPDNDTDGGRAYIANTIGYRRRKGTAAALSAVVGDLSTWPAIAVEFFRLVAAQQSINHLRPQNLRTPSLRQGDVLRLIGTPSDPVARSTDLRRPGKYLLDNVGVFIWRLKAYPVNSVPAAPAGPTGAYWFNVLGRDTPLFNPLRTLSGGAAPTAATVAAPLRPASLSDALEATRQALAAGQLPPDNPYFDQPPAFEIIVSRPELLGDPHLTQASLYPSGSPDPKPASIAINAGGGGVQVHTGTVTNGGGTFGGFARGIPSSLMAARHVYTLSYSVQSLNGNATLRFSNQSGAGDESALSHTVAIGPAWTRYSFTAVLDVPKPALYVWSVESDRLFLIDGLTLQEVAAGTPIGLASEPAPPAGTVPAVAPVLLPVPAEQIVVADLSSWQVPPASATYGTVTLPIAAAVDPARGRFVFSTPSTPLSGGPLVSYSYGFASDVGGGFYDRSATLTSAATPVSVAGGGTPTDPIVPAFPQPSAAQTAVQAVVQIADSLVYSPAALTVPANRVFVLQAANKQRPLLRSAQPWSITLGPGASLTLNGLLLDAGLSVTATGQASLSLVHCTLVPGQALVATGPLTVSLTSCITGGVQLDPTLSTLSAQDSVIDGSGGSAITAGPAATLDGCTVLGSATLDSLGTATDTLFCGTLKLTSTSTGSVSTSFVQDGTAAPGSLVTSLCQPALAVSLGAAADRAAIVTRVCPSFTSISYGDPGYAQLRRTCAPEILGGGSDQSEMGVFHDLYQPQMQANVLAGLGAYLRLGLGPTLFFVT
jgi:hypothetical protein